MLRRVQTTVLVVISLVVCACSAGLEGTYSDRHNIVEYRFSGSTVVQISQGVEVIFEYELDGDRLILKQPNGSVVVTYRMTEDGAIQTPMGTLRKRH